MSKRRRTALGRHHPARRFEAQAGLRTAPPPHLQHRQLGWTPGITPTWTVGQIRAILREHEQGQFWRSGELVDAMGRDDRIPAVLRYRVRGLLGMDFSMKVADEEDAAASEFADEWLQLWPRFASRDVLARLLQDYIMLGVGVAQISWEQVDTPAGRLWEPRLWNEHPCYLTYDEGNHRYYYQTREGSVIVEPGNGKWVLLEQGELGYRNGAVRALALLWHIRNLSWWDWARYTERHGMPLLKAKHPSSVTETVRDTWWNDIADLGRETIAMLPQGVGPDGEGFDLELLEAKDGNWKAFQELQRQASDSVAIYLLGNNLSTELRQGSFAAASVHDVVSLRVLQADEATLGDDLLQQAVRPISRMLRPGGDQIAARPTWDVEQPGDIHAEAATARTAAETLAILDQSGYEVASVEDYGAKFGIDIVKKKAARAPGVPETPPTDSTPPSPPSGDGEMPDPPSDPGIGGVRDGEMTGAIRDYRAGMFTAPDASTVHVHGAIDNEALSTSFDGEHSHIFRLPGGELVVAAGGDHAHDLHESFDQHAGDLFRVAPQTKANGEHVHSVRLPDGSFAATEIGGRHSHTLAGFFTFSATDHEHELRLPSGEVVYSLKADEVEKLDARSPLLAPAELSFKRPPREFREGQDFTDRLARGAAGDARDGKLLKKLVGIIESSDSYEEAEQRIVEAYAESAPGEVRKVLERAITVAELNGIHSAFEEIG